MKIKRRNFYLEFIIGIIVIYLAVLVILFIFQRNLMYHPLENNYSGDKLEVEIEKVNFIKIIGLVSCLIGVFAIIIKGDLNLLLNLNFTVGDLWMLAAAIGWALYSIYLFYWKSQLPIFQRFTLVAFFGAISLLPFYIIEEVVVQRTVFNSQFFLWVLFAAISPGIIAFTLYTQAQKSLGASLTGFTLYVFTIYAAIYGFIFFDEKLETFHYLGTVLVFFGVYLAKKNYETKT